MKTLAKFPLLAALVIGLTLMAAAACSGEPSQDSQSPESEPAATPTPTPTAPTEPAPPTPTAGAAGDSPGDSADGGDPGSAPDAPTPTAAAGSSSSSGATAGQAKPPENAVAGAVTWPPVIELPPGAVLEVRLLDASLQDAPSGLIASQSISNPGRGPVDLSLEFDPQDLDPEKSYVVQARILDPRGNPILSGGAAYNAPAGGRPNPVNLALAPVHPIPTPPLAAATPRPPGDGSGNGAPPGETPAIITGVAVERLSEGYLLTASFLRPQSEDCARISSYGYELEGANIRIELNLTPGPDSDNPEVCDGPRQTGAMEFSLDFPLEPQQTYSVIAGTSGLTNQFTLPESDFPAYVTSPSPVESAEIVVLEIFPPQYMLHVISGLPQGSGCSRFNGYDLRRPSPDTIEVTITHHAVDFDRVKDIACTADFPMVETAIPLGSDFESGAEYAVVVNGAATTTFLAQ